MARVVKLISWIHDFRGFSNPTFLTVECHANICDDTYLIWLWFRIESGLLWEKSAREALVTSAPGAITHFSFATCMHHSSHGQRWNYVLIFHRIFETKSNSLCANSWDVNLNINREHWGAYGWDGYKFVRLIVKPYVNKAIQSDFLYQTTVTMITFDGISR